MANAASGKPNPFVPARKERSKLRLLLTGPSGSGKTWTALEIAYRLADLEKGKVAFVDTEGRSASKYADHFSFDVLDLSNNYDPKLYVAAIERAAEYKYPVLITDSFSHAWNGAGGVLEIVDQAGQKMGDNKWAGWSKGRPAQNALVNAIVNAPIHLIGTARARTEWLVDETAGRKSKPRKIGLESVQSSEFEYEFDFACMIDMDHVMTITKSRHGKVLPVGMEITDIDAFVTMLYQWLNDGVEPQERPAQPVQPQNAQPPATTNFEDARNRMGASSAENPNGQRRVGGEQSDQQDKPAPHWATIEANQKRLNNLLDSLGLKASEVIGKLEQGKTLKRWTETSLTWEQTEARLREIATAPAQPQKPASVKTILTTDNEGPEVDSWIWDNFNRPPIEFMEELKIDAWAGKYATVEDARQAATTVAIKQKLPMVAREVAYITRDKQTYLEFKTPIPIRAYGRSTTFKAMIDAANPHWYEMNKLEGFKVGEIYPIDPISLNWEVKGKEPNTYLNITTIEEVLPPDEFNAGNSDQSPEGEPDPEALINQFFGPKD